MNSIGLITAADRVYYYGVSNIVRQADAFGLNVAIFDLGLEESQLAYLRSYPRVQILPNPKVVPEKVYGWQTWQKPFYFQNSPFDFTLWIDADVWINQSPLDAGMFDWLNKKPLFTIHWVSEYGLSVNHPLLYELYGDQNALGLKTIGVNAGVIGLAKKRDQELLDKWIWMVEEATLRRPALSHVGWPDRHIRNSICQFADEGALNWALKMVGKHEWIATNRNWNFWVQARNKPDFGFSFEETRFLIQVRHPKAILLHFASGMTGNYWAWYRRYRPTFPGSIPPARHE